MLASQLRVEASSVQELLERKVRARDAARAALADAQEQLEGLDVPGRWSDPDREEKRDPALKAARAAVEERRSTLTILEKELERVQSNREQTLRDAGDAGAFVRALMDAIGPDAAEFDERTRVVP